MQALFAAGRRDDDFFEGAAGGRFGGGGRFVSGRRGCEAGAGTYYKGA